MAATLRTGINLVEWLSKANKLKKLELPFSQLNEVIGPASFVEITGNKIGGQHYFLINLIAHALLPPRFGGQGAVAVVYDLGYTFVVEQLRRRLRQLIADAMHSAITRDIERMCEEAMKSFLLRECLTAEELLELLSSFEQDISRPHLRSKPLAFVVCQTIYPSILVDMDSKEDYEIVAQLKDIVNLFQTRVFVGTWSFSTNAGGRMSLHPPWRSLFQYTIICSFTPANPFIPSMAVQEAAGDDDLRSSFNKNQKHRVTIERNGRVVHIMTFNVSH